MNKDFPVELLEKNAALPPREIVYERFRHLVMGETESQAPELTDSTEAPAEVEAEAEPAQAVEDSEA
jgi:hypothetical protein